MNIEDKPIVLGRTNCKCDQRVKYGVLPRQLQMAKVHHYSEYAMDFLVV
jgi:hypothetical protein